MNILTQNTQLTNTLYEILDNANNYLKISEGIVIISFFVSIVSLIALIIISVRAGKRNEQQKIQLEEILKIVSELQNLTQRQQIIINKIDETNDRIYRETEVLKEIQKQTKNPSQEEQEEIKKKIEELNKMIK